MYEVQYSTIILHQNHPTVPIENVWIKCKIPTLNLNMPTITKWEACSPRFRLCMEFDILTDNVYQSPHTASILGLGCMVSRSSRIIISIQFIADSFCWKVWRIGSRPSVTSNVNLLHVLSPVYIEHRVLLVEIPPLFAVSGKID